MLQSQIAAQLYSFRNFIKTPAGVRDTLGKLRKIGYSAVQLSSSLAPMPVNNLAKLLSDQGFTAPTSHETSDSLVKETEQVIDKLKSLNCPHVAYPFPHYMPTSTGECIALAEELESVAKKFKAAGLTFSYHNHSHELQRFDNKTMLELLYDHAPTMEAEIDTFWIQRGGGNPVEWVEKMTNRMQVIHLKDYSVKPGTSEGIMAAIGTGNLNWQSIIAAAKQVGVTCYVVEHDGDCPDPFISFAASMEFLQNNFVNK